MKNTIAKIAAAISAAVLCAAPMTANAATSSSDFRCHIPRHASFNPDLATNIHLGDVNDDGRIDAIDASIVLSWAEKNGRNCTNLADMARVTGDYSITKEDANVILKVYAQRGANKNLVGDANNDGEIDMMDVNHIALALKYPEKYTINNRIYADVNRDNEVNVLDQNLIQRYLLGCFYSFEANFGDANDDGKLTYDDCNLIDQYIGKTWNNLCKENFRSMSKDLFLRSDVNGDGVITNVDSATVSWAVEGEGYPEVSIYEYDFSQIILPYPGPFIH